jgi:hypothetical protein
MERGKEPLSLMFSRALLGAHHFQLFTDFARILFLPLKSNK